MTQQPPAIDGPFRHDQFLLRRKVFKLFGGAFHLYDLSGNLLGYSKQKAFKLKEDIRLFTDESMTTELLTISARSVIDFGATYDVIDARDGTKVGALRRAGLKSLFRDKWLILDTADQEVGFVQEDSGGLAFVRRFVDAASLLIPQTFFAEYRGQRVMEMKQNFNPFVQKVTIDLRYDEQRSLDRRLATAAAILILAIEGKQS